MFDKFVQFYIRRQDATRVIEVLSCYSSGLKNHCDLNIITYNNRLGTPFTFKVSLHVRREELDFCLGDLFRLNQNGVFIDELKVK